MYISASWVCEVGVRFRLTTDPPLETIYITLKAFVRWGHPREPACMTPGWLDSSHTSTFAVTCRLLKKMCTSYPVHNFNSLPDALLCESKDSSSGRHGHCPSPLPYISIFKTSQPRSFAHSYPGFTHTYCFSLLTTRAPISISYDYLIHREKITVSR
jgi:hypothetical protein